MMRSTVCTSSCRLSKCSNSYYRLSWKSCRKTLLEPHYLAQNPSTTIFRSFGWITLCINSSCDMWFWCIRKSTQYIFEVNSRNKMFFLNNHRTAVQNENAILTGKGLRPVRSLKCKLTSCEKNQNTECHSEYNKGKIGRASCRERV